MQVSAHARRLNRPERAELCTLRQTAASCGAAPLPSTVTAGTSDPGEEPLEGPDVAGLPVHECSRDAPGFSQRLHATIDGKGRRIVGHRELCEDDVNWKPDAEMRYTRVR